MKKNQLIGLSILASTFSTAQAELKALDDSAMGELTGQAGLTIDVETESQFTHEERNIALEAVDMYLEYHKVELMDSDSDYMVYLTDLLTKRALENRDLMKEEGIKCLRLSDSIEDIEQEDNTADPLRIRCTHFSDDAVIRCTQFSEDAEVRCLLNNERDLLLEYNTTPDLDDSELRERLVRCLTPRH